MWKLLKIAALSSDPSLYKYFFQLPSVSYMSNTCFLNGKTSLNLDSLDCKKNNSEFIWVNYEVIDMMLARKSTSCRSIKY